MKQMIIDGKQIEVRKFANRDAAINYANKKEKKIVYARAHEYYVG